jgi:hypothetical protein
MASNLHAPLGGSVVAPATHGSMMAPPPSSSLAAARANSEHLHNASDDVPRWKRWLRRCLPFFFKHDEAHHTELLQLPDETKQARRALLDACQRAQEEYAARQARGEDVHHHRVHDMVTVSKGDAAAVVEDDVLSEEALLTMADSGTLPPPLMQFLGQWQRQRQELSRSGDPRAVSRLMAFEQAWAAFIPMVDLGMIAGGLQLHAAAPGGSGGSGAVTTPMPMTLPLTALDPRNADQRRALIAAWRRTLVRSQQLRRQLHYATENEAGVALLQTFLVDLLGTDSPAARFFALAVAKDFAAETQVASDVAQLAALTMLVIANGFALYFVLLRGVQQGPSWQQAFMLASVAQVFTEMLFFQPLEVLYVDVFLPSFAFTAVQRAQRQLSRLSRGLLASLKASVTSASSVPPGISSVSMDVPKSFFASRMVAEHEYRVAHLEQPVITAYRTLWPTGSLRTGVIAHADAAAHGHEAASDQPHGGHRLGTRLWAMCGAPWGPTWTQKVQQSLFAALTMIPLEGQRIMVRFFEPFLLGGLFLLWLIVANNVIFLAVFFVGTVLILGTALVLCLRSPVLLQQQEQQEAEQQQQQRLDDDKAAAATAAAAAIAEAHIGGPAPVERHRSPPAGTARPFVSSASMPLPVVAPAAVSAAAAGVSADADGILRYDQLDEQDDLERYRKPSASSEVDSLMLPSFPASPSQSPSPRLIHRKRLLSRQTSNGSDSGNDTAGASRIVRASSGSGRARLPPPMTIIRHHSNSSEYSGGSSFASLHENISFASLPDEDDGGRGGGGRASAGNGHRRDDDSDGSLSSSLDSFESFEFL